MNIELIISEALILLMLAINLIYFWKDETFAERFKVVSYGLISAVAMVFIWWAP